MTTPTKRRIMRTFRLEEISAVDNPAQVHARMVLMKRVGQESTMQKITRDEPMAFDTFEKAVAHLHKLQGGGRSAALSDAARRYPELVKRYNEDGIDIAKRAAEASAPQPLAKAIADFEIAVDEIAKRDRCTRSAAMSKARAELPAAFEAYQGA